MQTQEPIPNFIEQLSAYYPAMKIGVSVVEFLRVNYWSHLRQTAETDVELRASMPGMIVSPVKAVVYLGNTHLAIEYSGPTFVPAKLNETMHPLFSRTAGKRIWLTVLPM